ncbi:alpha/beta hydrolase [Pseudoduganella chitinolytica]|uniref:Alpha/beta fold hydrolase n=1 Tax=Pseudoduganella chitinolytica TaxID=34070 RepID=A0ABY8BJN2_9BURK|nr:alpha/beta fold hydrolase [Pseudoduganella chitinolytica]WEF35121.1 alpha/beta fold hydrolase [Pseudoduganella chitinolytica]
MQAPRSLSWPVALAALALAGPARADEHPIALQTPTGTLNGTLHLPQDTKPAAVVLIVAGSGPTDRDGNNPLAGRNDSLKMLAQALARSGYASVRYDKRGIGQSGAAGGDESALRLDTYVDDAAAWVDKLNASGRYPAVAVAGHSEGALIGMLAAQRGKVASFISLAGSADGLGALLRKQLASQLPPDLAVANERVLQSLEQGKPTADVPAPLLSLYRPSVQPYLISSLRYQPARELGKLNVPVLLVQGTTDIQVGVEQARALQAAKPDACLAIIPGMNHLLKEVAADLPAQQRSYGDPALPLHGELPATLAGFLRKPCQPPGKVTAG